METDANTLGEGTRELSTVLEGICADGSDIDPMIIYKCEEFVSEWFDNFRYDTPENILFR
jgi:hypothetical protein